MSNSAIAEKIARKPKVNLKRASDLRRDFESGNVKIDQKPRIEMPDIGENLEREPDIIVPENEVLKAELDKLAFNEEPVKIIIHRSGEKFQPKTTDLIAVNGKKAEMLFRNGWVQIGYLPRGVAFYTKRKYVEQLAHAKVDNIQTQHEDATVERPKNWIDRSTTASALFAVLEDKNPLGIPWLEELLRSQA